jgi:glycosyltransferase involved in cell wall biosynthesis
MATSTKKRLTVSVIIPTYNRARLIVEAIESALAQTRVPDEILVIDDGSTDNTQAVLERFGAPVHVLRQANRGRSAARNTGIREATSDAVLFLDSDDLLLPNAIEEFVTVLEERPDVDVVYANAKMIDAEGRLIAIYADRMPGARPSGNILGELARRCCLTICSMVRRSAARNIRFEEGMEFGEDYDFWRQLAAKSNFAYIDQLLTCYRFHKGMTIVSDPRKNMDAELEVQRRVLEMPEFAQLSRRERACAYAAHGAKQAMRNRGKVTRSMLWRAFVTDPTYKTTYGLFALSAVSLRPLQYAISKRRRMLGNHIAADAGGAALEQDRVESGKTSPVIVTDANAGTVEEHVYG